MIGYLESGSSVHRDLLCESDIQAFSCELLISPHVACKGREYIDNTYWAASKIRERGLMLGFCFCIRLLFIVNVLMRGFSGVVVTIHSSGLRSPLPDVAPPNS